MNTRFMAARTAAGGLRNQTSLLSLIEKFPAVALIAVSVILINLFVPALKFADVPVYLWITDSLYFFNPWGWLGFEAGSNLLFIGLRALAGNTETAIAAAHYLLGLLYVFAMFRFAQRKEVGWRGMLAQFGLYGALLAFVTIRATPAYMLVALAALKVNRGQMSGVWLALAGMLFHVSAVLAVVPVVIGLAQNRLKMLAWITTSTKALVATVGVGILAFGLLQTVFNSALVAVIGSIPFLNKYVIYTAGLDPLNAGQSTDRSINHLIYAMVLSAFVFAFVMMRDPNCRRMRGYVLASYAIFLVLEVSPVTAYRQSQFWMLPAVFVFPWQVVAPAGLRAWMFGGFCLLLFFSAVPGVIWW